MAGIHLDATYGTLDRTTRRIERSSTELNSMVNELGFIGVALVSTRLELRVIVEVINNKAGVREDDEKRRAFRSAIADQSRHRDETLAQYARRQRDFNQAANYGVIIPEPFRATMLKEGGGLNDQNTQNLSALLQGNDDDPNAVARALARLDVRSDRMPAYTEVQIAQDSYVSTTDDQEDDDDSLDDEDGARARALGLDRGPDLRGVRRA